MKFGNDTKTIGTACNEKKIKNLSTHAICSLHVPYSCAITAIDLSLIFLSCPLQWEWSKDN